MKKTVGLAASPGAQMHGTVNRMHVIAGGRNGVLLRVRSFRLVLPIFLMPSALRGIASFARYMRHPKLVLRPGRKCSVSQHALGSCDAAPSRARRLLACESEPHRSKLREALQQLSFGDRERLWVYLLRGSVTDAGPRRCVASLMPSYISVVLGKS